MHTDLITVQPKTTLVEARDILAENDVDHLLVVNTKGQLVGVISDRDLKQNWASPATALSTHELNYLLEKVEVGMIMVKTVITASPDTTIERAAYIMQTNNISCLPVKDGENLVGIITSTDVMGTLLEAIGMSESSVRLTLYVQDNVGELAKITDVFQEADINIQSLISWPVKNHPGIIQLVMRIDGEDGAQSVIALEKAGFKVATKYVKDIEPYLPQRP
ncbi:CBS and ACT domain-containing protein [Desulfogranum japonicum]|uniref:CBS and ACT domain-containing protein n=1 Tax=Desulfogranum japonicum TaxID=231447 RepID=UPI001E56FFB3|nr:CBS and ACT domain-containing protein [Desulfogranum japonicum]